MDIEIDLINKIKSKFAFSSQDLIVGIGDDAAIFHSNSSFEVVTCDAFYEQVHFDLRYTPPFFVGKKALCASLSDVAAMGGMPKFFLLSLAFPPPPPLDLIEQILGGLLETAKKYQVSLIGGNLSRAKELSLNITILGNIKPPLLTRSGAKPEDRIFVTGPLGGASLGMKLLKEKVKLKKKDSELISAYLEPKPKLKQGLLLKKIASSAIDISDGLKKDLSNLIKSSNVGAKIYLNQIPVFESYFIYADKFFQEKYEGILAGGEDYELLFTVPPDKTAELLKISQQNRLQISEIGKITPYPNKLEFILEDNKKYHFHGQEFNHWK
jgi:thiamine-monophosphate kinase